MTAIDPLKVALNSLLDAPVIHDPHVQVQYSKLLTSINAAWEMQKHAQSIHNSYCQWLDLAKVRMLLPSFQAIKELRIGITLIRESHNASFKVQRVLDIFRIETLNNELQPVPTPHPLFELFSYMSHIARSPLFEAVNKDINTQRATIHGVLTIKLSDMHNLYENTGTPSQWLSTLHFQES